MGRGCCQGACALSPTPSLSLHGRIGVLGSDLALPSLPQSCWNCGRKASETCSGCNAARYCGSFCQHKDWEKHHHVCGQSLQGPEAASGADPLPPQPDAASPGQAGSAGPSRPSSPTLPGPLDATVGR